MLILANGFFVAAEFALVRLRVTQLDGRIAQGSSTARVARNIVENIDEYLSATQLGITLASLGLGWIGEPAVARLLVAAFAGVGWHPSDRVLHSSAFLIAFSALSFAHIVAGEIAPKTLALARTESTALLVAWPMRIIRLVFFPALAVLNASSNLLLRLVGIRPAQGHSVAISRDELREIMAQQGTTLRADERGLLSKVFTFSDRVVREIMAPRSTVVALDASTKAPKEAIRFALAEGHSRYPVYDGSLDEIIGVLYMKDLMPLVSEGRPIHDLRTLVRPAVFVPESMPARELLQVLQRQKSHLAVVVDEYGGVSGIVTLEDALEELVGEIQDESDTERAPVEEVPGGYSVDGRLLLGELCGQIGIGLVPSDSDTVAGYVMERLGRVPRVGDQVALGDWAIRIAAMDRLRVDRVEVLRLQAASGA